ncbi:MAG TPA: hypothetical protein VKU38_03695 [Ktedonobacteraceae bacterium]|nr:hypothetical protein [Ktedonobacteraceae bacterium]
MIDTNKISIELDGGETHALMKAIVMRLEQLEKEVVTPQNKEEVQALFTVTQKLGPHITRKAAQYKQHEQDSLN